MTAFDLITLGVIVVSAMTGFTRGALRELVGLFAFTLSALGTIALLPVTAPLARHLVHPGWLAAATAAVVTFAGIFIMLRLLAASLTATLDRASLLGGANRLGGLVFGALRGLVVLGLFALLFNRVTPADLQPRWITRSLTYPMAQGSARLLQSVMPTRLRLPTGLPEMTDAVRAASRAAGDSENGTDADGSADAAKSRIPGETQRREAAIRSLERAKSKDHGYTKRARDSVDALVERSN